MCDDQTNSIILYGVSLSVVYIEESGDGLLLSRVTTKPVGFFRPIFFPYFEQKKDIKIFISKLSFLQPLKIAVCCMSVFS